MPEIAQALIVKALKASASFISLLAICWMPTATAQSQTSDLSLNGIAIHSELRRDIYVGALYVAVPSTDSQQLLLSEQDKRMALRVLTTRWSARSFEQHWTQSILINNDQQLLGAFSQAILDFNSAIQGPLLIGDELVIQQLLGKQLTVELNGKTIFTLDTKSRDFFNLLLNSWIGARPSSSRFKRDMLSAPADADDLTTIYDGLLPEPGRTANIAAWAVNDKSAKTSASKAPAVPTQTARIKSEASSAAPKTSTKTAAAKTQAPAKRVKDKKAAVVTAKADNQMALEQAELAKQYQQQLAKVRLQYRSNVMKQIYAQVVYPKRAVKMQQEGNVELSLRLSPDGQLIETALSDPSEYGLLNKAAIKAASAAAPFPPAPQKLSDSEISLLIPIRFQMPE